MILLDTHALIWLEARHPHAKRLAKVSTGLAISPATLLEMQFLLEQGRIRLKGSVLIGDLADDERWTLDEPPAAAWFDAARALAWTRDPFDRLIVAHALFRGWKLATADAIIREHLEPGQLFEL